MVGRKHLSLTVFRSHPRCPWGLRCAGHASPLHMGLVHIGPGAEWMLRALGMRLPT